jgi:hypothetical protein
MEQLSVIFTERLQPGGRSRRMAPSATCFGRKNRGVAQLLLTIPSAQARVHDRSNADGDPANPESKPESATKKKKNDN